MLIRGELLEEFKIALFDGDLSSFGLELPSCYLQDIIYFLSIYPIRSLKVSINKKELTIYFYNAIIYSCPLW